MTTTTEAIPDHLSGHVTTRIGHNQKDLIEGATGPWEVIIGLEVHAQVTSQAKLFSGASTAFGGDPNSHVSLVDAAMPGMLPVVNGECLRQAVRTGLGLGAQINLRSVFDRKNYFYPDLPPGYQISQFSQPIVGEGRVTVDLPDGESFEVGIERLHLEQDAGKSIHDQHPQKTYIDLNRAGVALMEIVSKPDIRSADEAAAYLAKLRSILRYLGTCDGDMSQGSMRADVNVSVRRPGEELGTRCEIKNVNSLRFVRQSVDYEARRQIEIIEDGGEIDQETRLFETPICCRLCSSKPSSTSWPRRCPNCPTPSRRALSTITACRPTTPACWSPSARRRNTTRPWSIPPAPSATPSSPPTV
jgi:aspartyl-tRNA(Asn)/glutamyl-tRNA(Gln) amidotransferase subunit B